MTADGKDAAVINISVVDREGREVPDADNLIRFSIVGNAKIIGVGNGDPSSHEPDKCAEGAWQRTLFNGKCQVIIQSGTTPGMIKFTAKATGLWDGGTDIQTVSVGNLGTVTKEDTYRVSSVNKKRLIKCWALIFLFYRNWKIKE
jgi:beta-galactosidase